MALASRKLPAFPHLLAADTPSMCCKSANQGGGVTIAAFQEEAPTMYQDEQNEYGCPLYDQRGSMAVRDFDAIIERLSPELRAAFEAERAARWLEQALFYATYTPPASAPTADGGVQAPALAIQKTWAWMEQLLRKIAQVTNYRPQKVTFFGS